MPIVKMTKQEQEINCKKSSIVRAKRLKLKQDLKKGLLEHKQVLLDYQNSKDKVVGKIKLFQFLQTVPKVGKVKSKKILEQLDMSEQKRISSLGNKQIQKIISVIEEL